MWILIVLSMKKVLVSLKKIILYHYMVTLIIMKHILELVISILMKFKIILYVVLEQDMNEKELHEVGTEV